MHGIPRERVVTTGAPKFDEWFERRPSSDGRASSPRRWAWIPRRPYVLYACSSAFIAPDEVGFVPRWLDGTPRARTTSGCGRSACSSGRTRRTPASGTASTSRRSRTSRSGRAAAPSRTRATRGRSSSTRSAHSAAVVGINTSALIEAAILGKSVLTPRTPEFAGTQEGTLHFRYVMFENGGFVHVGDDPRRHFEQLAAVLERGDEHAERTRRFVALVRPPARPRPSRRADPRRRRSRRSRASRRHRRRRRPEATRSGCCSPRSRWPRAWSAASRSGCAGARPSPSSPRTLGSAELLDRVARGSASRAGRGPGA